MTPPEPKTIIKVDEPRNNYGRRSMTTLMPADVRVAFIEAEGSETRFLVGEYIDEYDCWVMSFLKKVKGTYRVLNIPKVFKPSYDLCYKLWNVLGTCDNPPLAVLGGGLYFGEEYHTVRAWSKDTSFLFGKRVGEISAGHETAYQIVFSSAEDERVGYLAIFGGTKGKEERWHPIPIPAKLSNDPDSMDYINGKLAEHKAPLYEPPVFFN